jgi:hypothetical protein
MITSCVLLSQEKIKIIKSQSFPKNNDNLKKEEKEGQEMNNI